MPKFDTEIQNICFSVFIFMIVLNIFMSFFPVFVYFYNFCNKKKNDWMHPHLHAFIGCKEDIILEY